jgi:hypothetical protein
MSKDETDMKDGLEELVYYKMAYVIGVEHADID